MSQEPLLSALAAVPNLAVRAREPWARHSVFRVGGPAELWLVAETEQAALAAADLCRNHGLKLHPVDGDQIAAKDGGTDGAWLRPGGFAEGIVTGEGTLELGAMTPIAVAASFACRNGLGNLEKLSGAAGTVAEALRAGWLNDCTRGVRALRGTRISDLSPEQLRDGHVILRVTVEVQAKPATKLNSAVAKAIEGRRGRGPGLPGRLMDDPKSECAAELMAHSGLCGVRLRGVRLGLAEPNCVVNLGGATAEDLRLLRVLVRDRVKQQHGVELHPALRLLE